MAVLKMAVYRIQNMLDSLGMRLILFLFCAVLYGQEDPLAKGLDTPTVSAPPVIVLTPVDQKISATLLVTKDVAPATNVTPVLGSGLKKTVLPTFEAKQPGFYTFAAAEGGTDISIFLTSPAGHPFLLRSIPFLRGYEVKLDSIDLYGSFISGTVFVYVGSSYTPLKVTPKDDRITIPYPTRVMSGFVSITVYQFGGFCDSIVVKAQRPVHLH